jgi:3-phosphoshikimate 1-carboxyvinyltransferase
MPPLLDAITVEPGGPLIGNLRVPADKSMSHRAALLALLARGKSRIRNFLRSEDCLNTLACVEALGATVAWAGPDELHITGVGPENLKEPTGPLWCGNSGTTMRLLSGLLAGARGLFILDGDESLRRRPMGRVCQPLGQMGAQIWGRDGDRLAPLAIRGTPLQGMDYTSPIASAQVKSAILLAGLSAEGPTSVREPQRSRDHTERMLTACGAALEVDDTCVCLAGPATLEPLDFTVPGDISSAAFWLVGASIVPGSEVYLPGVGVNTTRSGVLDVLRAMGGDIKVENLREACGEPVCDFRVRSAALHGTTIRGALIPRLIDELPILAVAAGCAQGETTIADAHELRVKESDRLAAIANQLGALGLVSEERPDGLLLQGDTRWHGGSVESLGDHRMAMSLAIAALVSPSPVTVLGTHCIKTSYPGFWEDAAALGATSSPGSLT